MLEAALSSACIWKAAIFEPALFLDRSVPAAVLTQLDREMDSGNVAAALSHEDAIGLPRAVRFLRTRLEGNKDASILKADNTG